MRYCFTPTAWLQFKNETVTSAGGEEPGLSHTLVVCACERVQPLWKTLWQFLKRLNLELPSGPAIIWSIHPRELKTYVHTNVCSSIIYIRQKVKPPKSPTNEGINKLWYIHTMGYYSTIKKTKFWHMLQHIWILKTCKWRKSDTEDPLPCDSIYTKCPKQANPSKQKVN